MGIATAASRNALLSSPVRSSRAIRLALGAGAIAVAVLCGERAVDAVAAAQVLPGVKGLDPAEQIRKILMQEQDHQIDLATALGIEVPNVNK